MSIRPTTPEQLEAAFECKKLSFKTFLSKSFSVLSGGAVVAGFALHSHTTLALSLIVPGLIPLLANPFHILKNSTKRSTILDEHQFKETPALECSLLETAKVLRLTLRNAGKEQQDYMQKALELDYKESK